MATLVRWNPAYRIRPWRYDTPRNYWQTNPSWDSRVAMPLDIEENDDNYVITASVPGFTPEDIKISVEEGMLTIRAERDGDEEQDGAGWHLRERFFGTVERRLHLGEDVDAEHIEAELEYGVLRLTLPKAEETKPKLIEVKTA